MMKKALLIWWSTNTRACSILAEVAIMNKIPLCLVLDPSAKPPSNKVLSNSHVIKRDKKLLSRIEFEKFVKIFISSNIDSLILAPTSEYLMDLVSCWDEQDKLKNIQFPFFSDVSYRDLSSKENLYLIKNFPKEILPKRYKSEEILKKVKFYAKPKFNIIKQENLKPFLVSRYKNRSKFLNSQIDYFAQELVSGKSIYLCAYFDQGNKIHYYFQKNIIQNKVTTSVVFAKYLKNHKLFINSMKLLDYLTSINFKGAIMAEFKGDLNLLIEINPRFWGPLLLDITNDSKVLNNFFYDYFGIKITKPSYIPNTPFYVVPSQLNLKLGFKFFLFYIYKIFNANKIWINNSLGGDW